MVSTVTKEYKAFNDFQSKNLTEEINRLREENVNLIQSLQTVKKSLDIASIELIKERNMKQSLQDDLTHSIEMHEREVYMRLKFECKLNNITSI